MNNMSQHHRMLHKPVGKLLFSMAVPTVIVQIISVIYNTADTYFVSQIDTSASAAVGVAFSLMAIIQAFGFGIGMGANSIISRLLGAKKEEEAHYYGTSAAFMGLLIGLLIMILGLTFLKPLMKCMGSTPTILPYACEYTKYILLGAPFMCVAFVLNNLLRSQGRAIFAMVGLTIGGILNLILDPLFIFKFHMGIQGASLATMLSQIVSLTILSSMFLRGKSIVHIKKQYISRDYSIYGRILKTGFPTICRQGMASIASTVLNLSAAHYGDAAIAAITITNKLYMLVRSIVLGIGQGFQPIAGYNYGGGNLKRVRRVFFVSVVSGTIFCTLSSILILLFDEPIISWFRNDTEVIRIGRSALMFSCLSMPFMAYSTFVNQIYQCLGFSFWATILASCRQGIFFLPLALVLPGLLGITGMELLQPVSDLLTFVISIPFQIVFFKKYLRDSMT